MKINFGIWALIFLLGGCATSGEPDSRKWKTVSCGGYKGWDVCMNVALNACPKGFDLRGQEEDMYTQKRTMKFACR